MKDRYILALDQGTSSSRAIVFNASGDMVSLAQKEFTQYFPGQGLVEHDPEEIWSSQCAVMEEAVLKASLSGEDIAAIGITNQRETCIVWDATDGKPVCNAIVWQDRRTADFCEGLKASGMTEKIREKTGLVPDAYFSATKIRWILQNVPGAADRAARGDLRFGTVDSWLVWKLTGGKVHVTDVSNASRTMLFNIREMKWDEDLLEIFGIPFSMLPQVRSSSEVYGHAACGSILDGVPVAGIAGDQQAALLGHMCTEPGSMKCTYGTGCFLLMNCGTSPVMSSSNLLTTVAWKIGKEVNYAVEGSVFVAGSLVQWLRDGLGIIRSSSEIEALARTVPDNGGVYFVPALTGLGAPHWDSFARGAIYGIGRGTTAAHIARAALEGIACQTMEIVDAMRRDVSVDIRQLKVDGGASRNDLLMQIQADLTGVEVVRPVVTETTAFGAACLAALAVGFWDSLDSIRSLWKSGRTFSPQATPESVRHVRAAWADVVRRTMR